MLGKEIEVADPIVGCARPLKEEIEGLSVSGFLDGIISIVIRVNILGIQATDELRPHILQGL